METFLTFLALLAGLATLAGMVSILVPLTFVKIRSRKSGALVAVLGFLSLGIIGGGMEPRETADTGGEPQAENAPPPSVPQDAVPGLHRLQPADATEIDVVLGDRTGLVREISIIIEDAENLDVPGTLATLANSVPPPGLANSANIAVHVDRSYLGLTDTGAPFREMAGQIWRRAPDGRAQWAGLSRWQHPLGGEVLERERHYADRLRQAGENPMDPDGDAADLAIDATRQAYGMPADAWPLHQPGDLIQLDGNATEDLVEDGAADDAWLTALQAALAPVCRASPACIYALHIDEFDRLCRRSIDAMVLTDTDWPFLSTARERFSRFGFVDGNTDMLTIAGDQLRVENAFGTWVNHAYACEIHVDSQQVLDVILEPGRL